MVNPIALIKQGIETGDWEPICSAYEIFTSIKLEVPEEQDENALNVLKTLYKELDCFFHPVKTVSTVVDDDDDDEFNDPGENKTFLEEEVPHYVPDEEDEEDEEEEQPQVDLVSARARELKDAKTSGAEVDFNKFKVENKGTSGDKRQSKALPLKKGMKNTFVDDKSLAANALADSKWFSKKKKPEQRRPANKKVDVVCDKCKKNYEVEPIFAPKKIEGELTAYVCNTCLKKGFRRND